MKALTLISRIEIINLRTFTCDNNAIYLRSHPIDSQWFSQPLFWIIVWSTFIFIHDVTHRSHLDDQVLERIFSRSNLDHLNSSSFDLGFNKTLRLQTCTRHNFEKPGACLWIWVKWAQHQSPDPNGHTYWPLFNVQSRKRAVKLLDTSDVFTTQRNNKETCAFAYIFWFICTFICTIHFLLF